VPLWIEDEATYYYIPFAGADIQKLPADVNVEIPEKAPSVIISEISETGFRLQVGDMDFYLPRWRYPYFSDATEAEIRDVVLHGELLCWKALDLQFELEQLAHPEEGYCFGLLVRGVPRPDLFEGYALDKNGFRLIPKAAPAGVSADTPAQ